MLILLAAFAALSIFSANADGSARSESSPRPAADAAADTAPRAKTILEVRNDAFNDAVVYVIHGGMPIRLGTAGGVSTSKLTIPDHMIFGGTPLKFSLRSIGGRGRGITESIVVYRGDVVMMTIPAS